MLASDATCEIRESGEHLTPWRATLRPHPEAKFKPLDRHSRATKKALIQHRSRECLTRFEQSTLAQR